MAGRISTMTNLTTGQIRPKEDKKIRPISVLLTPDQLDHLDLIGRELGLNRHKLMRLIVADFIHRWLAGERPKTKTVTRKETVLDT